MNLIIVLGIGVVIALLTSSGQARDGVAGDIFDQAGSVAGIPPRLLRVIALRESGNDPRATPKPGSSQAARGLMQITGIARQDYNRRHGADLTPDDLWDPRINVSVGADLLRTIVQAYRQTGIPELRPDWNSRDWIDLLSLGYGAGHSARNGVIYAARALQKRGLAVNVANIQKWGPSIPGLYDEVYRPAKIKWCRETGGLYFGIKPS